VGFLRHALTEEKPLKTTLDNLEQRLMRIDGGALRLRGAEQQDPWGLGSSLGEREPSDVLRLRWHLEEAVAVEQAAAGVTNVLSERRRRVDLPESSATLHGRRSGVVRQQEQ
jgi:hypothetical protein